MACRSGMGGISCWPDAGGVSDQAAWIFDAFAVLGAAAAEEDKRRQEGAE
jgi:hypothetical protein